MFLSHFGLSVNPFGLSPRLDFLFKSNAFEESMAHLVYGLDNSEAIVMITGSIGTGKTMAIQSFLNSLDQSFTFALVTNTKVNSLELLKLILEDLDVSFPPSSDKSDVLILFKDFLISESKAGRKVLIVIDEAQNLEREVLEEIRLLTNLGQGEGQPVQLILLGQPELSANINAEGLAQLRQRIRVHYNLDTLTREELEGYINHRMSVAGCSRSAFSKQALDQIFAFSNGVPRLVNSLAGNGLLSAFVAGRQMVADEDIDPEELMGVKDVSQPLTNSENLVYSSPKPTRNSNKKSTIIWALIFILLIGGSWVIYQYDVLNKVFDRDLQKSEKEVHPAVVEKETNSIAEYQSEDVIAEQDGLASNTPNANENVKVDEQFEVHIASFQSLNRAHALIFQISPIITKAYTREQVVGGVVWHRVYLGPFANQEDAEEWVGKVLAVQPIEYYTIGEIPEGKKSAG